MYSQLLQNPLVLAGSFGMEALLKSIYRYYINVREYFEIGSLETIFLKHKNTKSTSAN